MAPGSSALRPCRSPCKRARCRSAEALAKSRDFCVENSSLIVEVLAANLHPQGLRLATLRPGGHRAHGRAGCGDQGLGTQVRRWPRRISLNLGILNLLPFPILDGGMILLLLIESVIRRDISINVKERIYQAAFVVLVAFFAFVIFNDVPSCRSSPT